jgi:hypothetical protein
MTVNRRLLLVAILSAITLSVHAGRAENASPWQGTWNGTVGVSQPWPVSVTIANGKVVNFSEDGVPFDVEYAKITPTMVTFGDQIHYSATLTWAGEKAASVTLHGRHGFQTGSLTK